MFKNGYDLRPNSQIVKRREHTPITGKKVKNEVTKITPKSGAVRQQRISFIEKKQVQTNETVQNQSFKSNESKPSFYQPTKSQVQNMNSRPQNSNVQKDILQKMNGKSQNRTNNCLYEANNVNTSVSNASVIISQVKQMGNKSVLIVKPNHFGANNAVNDSGLSQSRYQKRRVHQSNDNKQNRFSLNKQNSLVKETNKDYMKNSKVSNFFRLDNSSQNDRNITDRQVKVLKRQDNNILSTVNKSSQSMNGNKFSSSSLSSKVASNVTAKLRSSSTRVTRKQQLASTINSMTKNHSYTSKGKWKM